MYNFDKIAQRRNTDSYKWDVLNDELPMWVADMDFMVAPQIRDSIVERASIMAYGYSNVPDSFYEAYKSFFQKRHDLKLDTKWMIFSTGVVPSISSCVRALTSVLDNVLIMSPVYNIFYNSIRNNNRNILTSNLIYDGKTYSIDFSDLEEKLKDEKTKLFIFCNPHNPCGNIFSLDELKKIVLLCKKYNVILISDEIHCDIIEPGFNYNPILKIEEAKDITIMLCSASKCYNLAGLQASIAVVPNKDLRYRVYRGINNDECGENNFFSAHAHTVALNLCQNWLDEMNSYVKNNKDYVIDFILNNIKELKVVESKALYLMWIDISKLNVDSDEFCIFLRKKTGLYISSGKAYGENGNGFVRINVATSKENVIDACNRLKIAVGLLKNR